MTRDCQPNGGLWQRTHAMMPKAEIESHDIILAVKVIGFHNLIGYIIEELQVWCPKSPDPFPRERWSLGTRLHTAV